MGPDPCHAIVSLHAWVDVGACHETLQESGLSHALEHMVFRRTRRFTGPVISRWIESAGGMLNAETTRDHTHFHIDAPSGALPRALQVMEELLEGARLTERDWAQERRVILEEIKRRHDDPMSFLWDQLNARCFPNHPLGRPIVGSPDTVARWSAQTLRDFYERHYRPENIVITLAGDFDPLQARRHLQGWFQRLPRRHPPRGSRTVRDTSHPLHDFPPSPAAGPRDHRIRKAVHQTYIAMATPTPPSKDPIHPVLDLLAVLLGEGRGARLVRQWREEKRLAWAIHAGNWEQQSAGLFGVFAECAPRNEAALRKGIWETLLALRRRPPSSHEVQRAKNMIHSAWLRRYETFHHRASAWGLYGLEGHLERLRTYLPQVMSLRAADIEKAAQRYLNPERWVSVILEPLSR